MPKSSELSVDLRKLIVTDHEKGLGYANIAKKFCRSKSTIQRVIQNYKKNKTYESAPRSGRPRATTAHDDARMVREMKKQRTNSARIIKENVEVAVSERTIQRRMREKGFSSHYKLRKPFISKKNVKARLLFAKKYSKMPLSFWEKVIWSDESKFELKNTKKRQRVWRKAGEKLKSACVQSTIKHGGGNVLVWGCFSYHGTSKLVQIDGRMTGESYVQILDNYLKPSAQEMGLQADFIYQQDNDPKHTSRVAKEYFSENAIELLEWPAQSPDLNPIEHLWQYLDENLSRDSGQSSKKEIFTKLSDIWENIPKTTLQSLVHSMPRRLLAVINVKGGNTKY